MKDGVVVSGTERFRAGELGETTSYVGALIVSMW